MKIEFDPNKDRLNIAKHGISLIMANQLEWDLMMCSEDDREAYGEQRLACFAPIGIYAWLKRMTAIVSLACEKPNRKR